MSAGASAGQDLGAVFAGLMAAESLVAAETPEAPAEEGPVEASAVDASQPLVSSALMLALQPRSAPLPVNIAEPEPGTSHTEGGSEPSPDSPVADTAVQTEPLEDGPALSLPGALPAGSTPTASLAPQAAPAASSTPAGPRPSAPTAPEPALAEVQQGPTPAESTPDADLEAQVARTLAAAQPTPASTPAPAAQMASSSAALIAAAGAVANRPARVEGQPPSNASAARSAEAPATDRDVADATTMAGEDNLTARPVASQSGAAASGAGQPGPGGSGAPGAGVTPQPTALAATLTADGVGDGPAGSPLAGGNPPPTAPPAALPASVNSAAFSQLAQSTLDTTIHLAAQITRRLEGRTTRFEMGLTPEGLGRVDVKLDIDAGGRLTARLAFDNPLAATEMRGRADELRRELQAAGFEIAHDGLEFSDRQSSSSGQGFDQGQGRAFAGASRVNAEADLATPANAPWMSLNLTPRGVDMKV